jgi:Calcineurin-like phosphoesterase
MPMKINIDPVISSRIKKSWAQLTPAQQAEIAPMILGANDQAVQVAQTGKAPPTPAAPHTLMLAHSAMTGDSDAVVGNLEAGVVITVGTDGVIWGTGKWEQFDPGWAESFAVFLESLIGGKHPFVSAPQTVAIPDQVKISIAGDWGTGDWRTYSNPAPSTDVRKHMALLIPDITIHLGDVYYAGTSDQEQHLLVELWPPGPSGSFALNSNHEMYSGAKPYFQAIGNPPFDKQGGCSYFALENSNWVIVGLDSAYFAPEGGLYMDGLLFPEGKPNAQNSFLLEKGVQAQLKGKKLILLTHHNGLDVGGLKANLLYSQVMDAFPGENKPAYWYWGHEHVGAAYKPDESTGVRCRCCGHGALPWGQSSDLANSQNVEWYERRSANDSDIPQRVLNGFAMLKLDGPNIQEVFYDENGGVAWTSAS